MRDNDHRRHTTIRYIVVVVLGLAEASFAGGGAVQQAGSRPAQHRDGTVKITPIGQKSGEFCNHDRALLFEDPSGVRILYDPGVTIRSASDPRLGDVHVILVSHNHLDHIGHTWMTQDPEDPRASCDALQGQVPILPATVVETLTAAKHAALLAGLGAAKFFATRVGKRCYTASPLTYETTVPAPAPCVGPLDFGAKRIVTMSQGAPGVRIATVAALHPDNFWEPELFASPLRDELRENGLTGYPGLACGFVLMFSNGLRVYLSGDTGPTSDMRTIVGDFYRPQLAVLNIDGVGTLAPEEAAFATRSLIRATGVIPSSASTAVTEGGKLLPNTPIAQFVALMPDVPIYLPLSGQVMQFDGQGNRAR